MFGLKSSREIWKALEATYASLSEMTVLQLRSQLQSTKKRSLKITDYCKKIKKIANQMAAAGNPISEKELILCILSGLGFEYSNIVVNFTI